MHKHVGDHKYPQVMAMWKKLVNNWCDRLDPFPRIMVKLVHLAMWCWNTVNKSSNYQPNNGISCSDTTKENQEKLGASECVRFIRLSLPNIWRFMCLESWIPTHTHLSCHFWGNGKRTPTCSVLFGSLWRRITSWTRMWSHGFEVCPAKPSFLLV